MMLQKIVEDKFLIKGLNKRNEITRLIFEILKKYDINFTEFLNYPEIKSYLSKKRADFHRLKQTLLKIRYPLTSQNNELNNYKVYLPRLSYPQKQESTLPFSTPYRPRKIFIEKEALRFPLTEKILSKFAIKNVQIIDSLKNFKRNWRDYITTMGKDEIFLVKEDYDILKPCPCTKNVVCCGYYIFNLGFGCIYNCSYCYLQHYTNFPGIILPVNIKDILNKLKIKLKKTKIVMRRIGTGEFTDSLMLDNITEYTKYLIPFFEKTDYILELKTKSTNIENILNFKASKNIVVAWSLNPAKIVETEEHWTPSLLERLEAAKKLVDAGFKVAFHFDPVIFYDGWEKDYQETIKQMYEYAGANIVWISIGTLRFQRTLKPIIEQRFPNTKILDGELFIHPIDDKMRYPDFIRQEVYKKMIKWLRYYNKKVTIYLCMEPANIWQQADSRILNFSF